MATHPVGPILHLPVSYLPWTVGGKEVYCHRLGRQLSAIGVESSVAIHSDAFNRAAPGAYEHEGVPIRVLPPLVCSRRREASYSCTPDATPGFAELLDALRPQIVHFHDFSPGAGIQHLRQAKQAGAKIVMAYQSVGQTCLQRSLWLRGDPGNVCDGLIEQKRCTRCRLGDRGTPRVIAALADRLSFIPVDDESGSPLSRYLSAPRMTARFIEAWNECVSLVDVFHTGAAWAADLLRANGVPPQNIRHIRHGVAEIADPIPPTRSAAVGLTIGIVGRSDPVKGHHVLIEAVQRLRPDARIRVVLVGPVLESEYGRRLRAIIAGDQRFQVQPAVAPRELLATMAGFDLLAVPSLWMETGPQVILDAHSVGVPVLGSRLGGIAELVRDGVDGMLFAAGDSGGLARILETLLDDPSRIERMRAAVPRPRHVSQVAEDVVDLYRAL